MKVVNSVAYLFFFILLHISVRQWEDRTQNLRNEGLIKILLFTSKVEHQQAELVFSLSIA